MPLDASVIYLGTPGYGRMATVTAHRLKTRTVDIRLEPANELPQFGQQVLASVPGETYCNGNEAARRVGLPASVFSRLTGLLQINIERAGRDGKGRTDRVNVGVGIKMHSKMLKVCLYCVRSRRRCRPRAPTFVSLTLPHSGFPFPPSR